MPQDSYPYAVGRVRVLETRLLDRARWNRLKEADLSDALKILIEAGYGAGAADKTDVDSLIEAELENTRALIYEITPEERLTNLFLLRTDAHNLKTLLKARMVGVDADDTLIAGGVLPLEQVKESVRSGDYSALPPAFQSAMEKAEAILEKDGDPRALSAAIDEAVFAHALSVLKKHKNGAIESYFTAQIDFLNVLSAIRARTLGWSEEKLIPLLIPGGNIPEETFTESLRVPTEQLAKVLGVGPYGRLIASAMEEFRETGSAQGVERRMDGALMTAVREGKYDSFSMGPILGYLLGREAEAKALRVLFAAKRAGVSAQLPELYV